MNHYTCMKCLKPATKAQMSEPTAKDTKKGGASKRCPGCGCRTFMTGGRNA